VTLALALITGGTPLIEGEVSFDWAYCESPHSPECVE
jgi:hypothetical protein